MTTPRSIATDFNPAEPDTSDPAPRSAVAAALEAASLDELGAAYLRKKAAGPQGTPTAATEPAAPAPDILGDLEKLLVRQIEPPAVPPEDRERIAALSEKATAVIKRCEGLAEQYQGFLDRLDTLRRHPKFAEVVGLQLSRLENLRDRVDGHLAHGAAALAARKRLEALLDPTLSDGERKKLIVEPTWIVTNLFSAGDTEFRSNIEELQALVAAVVRSHGKVQLIVSPILPEPPLASQPADAGGR